MELYLAQPVWYEERDMPYWGPPPNTLGWIDLRSLFQCGAPGPVQQGFGLMVLSQKAPVGYYLGDNLNAVMTDVRKAEVKAAIGLGEDIVADDVLGMLVELMTRYADINGQERWKPLIPTVNRRMEIYLAGEKVWDEPFDKLNHPQVLDAARNSYRWNREYDISVGSNHYQQYLQAMVDKYRVPWEDLIPSGLPKESPKPRASIIGDTFVDSDATDLDAHTATGPNGGFGWAEQAGDTDIMSNEAVVQVTEASARAESDLDSDDHYAEMVITNHSNDPGVNCRFNPAVSNTYYHWRLEGDPGNNLQLFQRITGSFTQIGSNVADSSSTPYTLRVSADGSTIKGLLGGVEKISETNGNISGFLRAGFRGNGVGDSFDNFEAADLAVVASKPYYYRMYGKGQN